MRPVTAPASVSASAPPAPTAPPQGASGGAVTPTVLSVQRRAAAPVPIARVDREIELRPAEPFVPPAAEPPAGRIRSLLRRAVGVPTPSGEAPTMATTPARASAASPAHTTRGGAQPTAAPRATARSVARAASPTGSVISGGPGDGVFSSVAGPPPARVSRSAAAPRAAAQPTSAAAPRATAQPTSAAASLLLRRKSDLAPVDETTSRWSAALPVTAWAADPIAPGSADSLTTDTYTSDAFTAEAFTSDGFAAEARAVEAYSAASDDGPAVARTAADPDPLGFSHDAASPPPGFSFAADSAASDDPSTATPAARSGLARVPSIAPESTAAFAGPAPAPLSPAARKLSSAFAARQAAASPGRGGPSAAASSAAAALADGAAVVHDGQSMTVEFPQPSASALAVAREPEAPLSGESAAPATTTAPAASSTAPAAAAAPALDKDELYDEFMRRMRRDVQYERELRGELF